MSIFNIAKTERKLTCGITNIPLTKPAKITFLEDLDNLDNLQKIIQFYKSMNIEYTSNTNKHSKTVLFSSTNELDYKTIQMTWRNFKTLHPKFDSQWRYLFWEIDTFDTDSLQRVVNIYSYLKLPLYFHKTKRGYHFFTLRPILDNVMLYAVKQMRETNKDYPPITLRVNANKHDNELEDFKQHVFIWSKPDYDLRMFAEAIGKQDFTYLEQKYQLVWYPINSNNLEGLYTP